MKKSNIILVFPLLWTMTSCGGTIDERNNIINALLKGFHVEITGSEQVIFPEEHSIYNKTNIININRDYNDIVEKDGSITPAIRDNVGTSSTTYFKGENGEATFELLSPKNEVLVEPLKYSNSSVLFNKYFVNPFVYIDIEDISEDYHLNPIKASLVVEKLTGYACAVESAKFTVDNHVANGLSLEFIDRIDGFQSLDGLLSVTNHYEMDIKFSYGVNEVTHLLPRPKADDSLKQAFEEKENYTLTFESDSSTQTAIAYVTKDAVYLHQSISTESMINGDMFYKKTSSGTYDLYTYNESSNKFSFKSFDIKKDSFLPNNSSISPDILLKQSENIYSLDSVAAHYSLERFILPHFKVPTGLGIKGTLKLKDGNISTLHAQFDKTYPFSITQNYFNYGTTAMPSWLDLSLIK